MKWLDAPYPTIESVKLKLAISFAMGLVCAIFLLVFQPFGLNTVADRPGFFFGFGMMAVIALLSAYFILPTIWPKYFDPEQWQIKNELIFFSAVILQISVLIFVYNSTVGRAFSPQHSYPSFLLMTIAVGVLPILIMTYITERVARGRNTATAQQLSNLQSGNTDGATTTRRPNVDSLPDEELSKNIVLTIESEDKAPVTLEIPLDDFLYAQAQNNYVQVYWQQEEELKNQLLRLKLKRLLAQIEFEPSILRVHKSYAVSKSAIINITGNARSLQLTLKGCDQKIPVSRSFDKGFLR